MTNILKEILLHLALPFIWLAGIMLGLLSGATFYFLLALSPILLLIPQTRPFIKKSLKEMLE